MSLCFNNDCFNEECDVFEIKAAGDIRCFFFFKNYDWNAYLKLKQISIFQKVLFKSFSMENTNTFFSK